MLGKIILKVTFGVYLVYFHEKNRKNRTNRKIRIFHPKITETEFPKTETELETLIACLL